MASSGTGSGLGKKGKTKWKSLPLVEVYDPGLPRKTTNWVDQVDSDLNGDLFDYSHKTEKVVLPTAPRAARAPENEAKVPKEPPFQAYISNLPYEITEDELTDFFSDMKIKGVRLPRDDRGNRARGFGYVEFEDRASLISALALGDMPLKGRRMRIEVAEHSDLNRGMGKGQRDGNRGGDPDRTMGDWRSGPRNDDSREDRDSYRGGSRRDYGGSGFSRRDGDRGGFRDKDRDGFSDRGGGVFSSDRGGSGFRDRGRDRDHNRDEYGGGGFRDSDRGYRDSDRSYYSDRRDRDGDRGGGGAGTWRRESDRDRDRGDSLPPPEKSEPKTRTKLNLQPRTKPIEEVVAKEESADEAPASTAAAASIFGGARPVDTAAREREIEERLAREKEEKLEEASRSRTAPPSSKDKDRDKEKDRDRDQVPPPSKEDSQPPPSSRNLEPAPPPKENAWGRRTQPPQVNNGRESPHEESDSSSKQRDATPPPHRQSGKEDTRESDSQKKYQPPRRHQQESEQKRNRDDDRKKDEKWKSGVGPVSQRGGSSSGVGLAKSGDGRQSTPRARDVRKDSGGDDISRMPKLQEHVAPNFAASNKFAFLDDTDTAPED